MFTELIVLEIMYEIGILSCDCTVSKMTKKPMK
jgi:hypothetical protein